jgi:hypothetical protein
MINIFSDNYKWVLGQAKVETALNNNTAYPATSEYIDVSGYNGVHVFIHLGTLADSVVFTLKQTDGISGTTLDTIDATYCKKTVATTDGGQCLYFYLDPEMLSADHHFITTYVSSVSGSDYADIFYLLGPARHSPVTQTSTVLPSDNVKEQHAR